MKKKLEQELKNYLDSSTKFTPYYEMMNQIVTSSLFDSQLQDIMRELENEDQDNAKRFKLYLDTVIINMQSKIAKYKPSLFFDDAKVKEIENQGYVIPFYCDESHETYVLLGIYKKTTNNGNS